MSKRTVKDLDNILVMVEHFTILKHQHKLSKAWGKIRRRMWMARQQIPLKELDPKKIFAPWTDEQVNMLKQWQKGFLLKELPNKGLKVLPVHPYTCGHVECDRSTRADEVILIPYRTGWTCPCGKYKQYWFIE